MFSSAWLDNRPYQNCSMVRQQAIPELQQYKSVIYCHALTQTIFCRLPTVMWLCTHLQLLNWEDESDNMVNGCGHNTFSYTVKHSYGSTQWEIFIKRPNEDLHKSEIKSYH
jgi:hypothetical protein